MDDAVRRALVVVLPALRAFRVFRIRFGREAAEERAHEVGRVDVAGGERHREVGRTTTGRQVQRVVEGAVQR